MSMNNKGLGRGLDALFNASQNREEPVAGDSRSSLLNVSIDAISPNPNQPRIVFSNESLEELASSIRSKGVLQPLLVRPGGKEGVYQLIAGERRWRAAKMAGLETVPVMAREIDDNEAMILALMENIQREDLNPIEEAKAFMALKVALNVNQDDLAEKLGMTRSAINNSLRLLRLGEAAQDDLANGRMTQGHARTLLSLPEGEVVDELRRRIIEDGITVREAEDAVRFWHSENRFPWQEEASDKAWVEKNKEKPGKDPEMQRLAKTIGATLNCRARINGNVDKGRISLAYESNEQLFELLEKLGLSLTS